MPHFHLFDFWAAVTAYPWTTLVLWACAMVFLGKVVWRIHREDTEQHARAQRQQAEWDRFNREAAEWCTKQRIAIRIRQNHSDDPKKAA